MNPSRTCVDWRQRITTDGDAPVVRGCGLPVRDGLRELAVHGAAEVLRRHPGLCQEDIDACLAFAAEALQGGPSAVPAPETVTLPPAPQVESATLPPRNGGESPTLPPDPSIQLPRFGITVPGYEILGELGRGGMGVVYKARHLRLNRLVALKMILAGEHASAEMRSRFQTEAEAVARLQHPGIVQIFEVGEHEGHSFLALEFVEGGSLASQLTQEPWDAMEAAALVEKLARAVHAAHEKGIVHRDLKPENVLLTGPTVREGAASTNAPGNALPHGRAYELAPKITDFGLAKKLEATGQTQTGAVMGTPSYMAPEQAAGRKDVGPAADVWALGAILYRLLAGRPPFEGPTTMDVLLRVMEDEPTKLHEINRKVPRDLESIVLKCLRKNAKERYDNSLTLAEDLRRFLDRDPILARHPSSVKRLWHWLVNHPGAVIARITTLVLLLGVCMTAAWMQLELLSLGIATVLVLWAGALRGHPRSMIVGVVVAGPIGLLLLSFHDPTREVLSQFGHSGNRYYETFNWVFPFALGAIVAGTVLREDWGVVNSAIALSAFAIFFSPQVLTVSLVSSPIVLVYSIIARVAQHYLGGNLVDIACASLLGTTAGLVVGGIVSTLTMKVEIIVELRYAFLGTMIGFSLVGTIAGAMFGAVVSRPRRATTSQ